MNSQRASWLSIFSLLLVAAAGLGCRGEGAAPESTPSVLSPAAAVADSPAPDWQEAVAAWKQARHERLERPDGWLTLVGLSWLKLGDHRVGSDAASAVLLPAGKAPETVGVLTVEAGKVTFQAAPGVVVTSAGKPIATQVLVTDHDGDPTILEHGPLSFFVIERAGRLAVRVRDREAETLKEFAGLDYYPLDPKWRLDARFEPAAEIREIPIPNAVGYDEPIKSPGHVVFAVDGKEFRLLALDDTGDGRLFLVFGDPTNGAETYGGGRFLYTDPPRAGKVVVDFNRAYNPPCVFTPFATCPLPPKGNKLPFPIRAGEKKYAHEAAHAATATFAAPSSPGA